MKLADFLERFYQIQHDLDEQSSYLQKLTSTSETMAAALDSVRGEVLKLAALFELLVEDTRLQKRNEIERAEKERERAHELKKLKTKGWIKVVIIAVTTASTIATSLVVLLDKLNQ